MDRLRQVPGLDGYYFQIYLCPEWTEIREAQLQIAKDFNIEVDPSNNFASNKQHLTVTGFDWFKYSTGFSQVSYVNTIAKCTETSPIWNSLSLKEDFAFRDESIPYELSLYFDNGTFGFPFLPPDPVTYENRFKVLCTFPLWLIVAEGASAIYGLPNCKKPELEEGIKLLWIGDKDDKNREVYNVQIVSRFLNVSIDYKFLTITDSWRKVNT